MCSTWLPTVFGEITSRSAISLFDSPRASSLSTSTSRGVSPAGPSRRRGTRWPAAPARPRPPRRRGGRPAPRRAARRRRPPPSARPVRARLAHRLVGVGRAEDARGLGDRRARQAARVAGAVEALAVLDGDRRERRERLRLAQHPLGQVRLQPDALPLAGAQRAALVPDRVRDPKPPEVVDEPGAPQRADLRLGRPSRSPPRAARSATARA